MFSNVRKTIKDVILRTRCELWPYSTVGDVRLPLDARLSVAMRRRIVNGNYEKQERRIIEATLDRDDCVLECGAGIGLLSTVAAKHVGSDRVRAFEANPKMAEIIQRTYELNDVWPTLVIGAIGAAPGVLTFHVQEDFWASSSHAMRADGAIETIQVPVHSLDAEVASTNPTYLFIDIEGAEDQLTGSSMLPGVRKIMCEFHPALIGSQGVQRFTDWLTSLGFAQDSTYSRDIHFYFFR
jgi:FkbM family methyltransferase